MTDNYMKTNNSNENNERRILELEAKVYSLQAQVSALAGMTLGYMESHQVQLDRKPAAQFNQEKQVEKLDQLLASLADTDPARATQIRELLMPRKMLQGQQKPALDRRGP
jgi:hypothetical protein